VEGLLLIPMGLLWLAWGFLVGHLVYKWKHGRGLQLLATLFALWLPLWDLIPGYLLYKKAIREVGGIRIYRTVEAEGYLDRSLITSNCWKSLKGRPFLYCENYERNNDHSALGPLNAAAGYYEYRLAPIDTPECTPFHQLNVEVMRTSHQLGDKCVVATRRDEPASRYEFAMGAGSYAEAWLVPPAELGWMRVNDRVTGEVVAQSTTVGYRPWIWRTRLGIPLEWRYTQDQYGRPIRLLPEDVIRSTK